jgi:hypothetical protein
MSKEQDKAAEMAALKEQMKKELEEECAKQLGEWQVKGKNRRLRVDSNASNTKVGGSGLGSSKGKASSESNSSGRDDDESSGGQPSEQ